MNTQSKAITPAHPALWQRTDFLVLILITAAYIVMLLLMPLQHDFATVDDWSYYHAVEKIISGGGYSPPGWAQMTLVFHAYWGALFAWLFGLSFTSLTAATMTMSLTGALAFYLLLRQLNFVIGYAGLGIAVFILTPVYLSLSYSFMTDITFLTLALLSSLFYIKGFEANSDIWLWLGGFVAALAFLTRQFGLALPLTALIYMAYASKLNLRRAFAITLLPILATLAYSIWRAGFPYTLSDDAQRQTLVSWLHDPIGTLSSQGLILLTSLPALGIAIPIWYVLRRNEIVIVWLALIGTSVYTLGEATRTSRAQRIDLRADPIFGQPFQLDSTPAWWIAVALAALIMAWLSERTWAWLASLRPHRAAQPADFIYILSLILAIGTFFTSYFGFIDRYQMTLYPAIIVAGLHGLRQAPRWRLMLTIATLVIIASYSITLHLDDFDFYRTQWQAADWAIQHGASYDRLDGGYAWDGYYFFDEANRRLNSTDFVAVGFAPNKALDREYIISINPKPGYHSLAQFPYFSRLDGWTTHQLLVLQRDKLAY